MTYRPRHALARVVRSLSPKARAAVVAAAALAASAGGLAAAGASGASNAAYAYTVSGHNISMGQQFYGLCLDDYKQDTSAGAPVVIWACSSTDPGQQWYPAPDGTIRLGNANGPALDATSGGKVVMGSSTDANAKWYPLGDWGLVNLGQSQVASGMVGPSLKVLNDPGYATTQGTQQVTYQRTMTTNAQYNIPGTTYAQTSYTDRPDSGNAAGSPNWALDNATRYASVTSLGSKYEGSIADDNGTFLTMPNGAPNGTGTIANVVQGTFSGTSGFSFTATGGSPNSANVPATAFGGPGHASGPSTSNWFQSFFPTGTTFGGTGIDNGPDAMGWSWQYSACSGGSTNAWVDAATNNSGIGSGDGNITGGC